jgi:hypothetical protein
MGKVTFPPEPQGFAFDIETILSLAWAFSCMPLAQLATKWALPKSTSTKYKVLFWWTTYDFLTHFMIEAFYLYHSLFSYIQLPAPISSAIPGDHIPYLYGRADRRYGAFYADTPTGRLWQEYAKADKRWGGADLCVICLEILTCCVAAPIEVYTAYQIYKYANANRSAVKAAAYTMLWFTAMTTATMELYGGFMTFGPEWLSGNTQLDTTNPIYVYLYLTFFNILWVFFPFWILYVGYLEMSKAFTMVVDSAKKSN